MHKGKQPFPKAVDRWRLQRKHEPQVHPGGHDQGSGGSTGPSLSPPTPAPTPQLQYDEPLFSARNFRANFVVGDGIGGAGGQDGLAAPHSEDTWRAVSIGGVPFAVTGSCARCAMIDLDPETGDVQRRRQSKAAKGRRVSALRVLASYRRRHSEILFGRYLALAGASPDLACTNAELTLPTAIAGGAENQMN